MAIIKNWFNECRRSRTSVFDESRLRAPIAATTEDIVTESRNLVLADRRLKVHEIAEIIG